MDPNISSSDNDRVPGGGGWSHSQWQKVERIHSRFSPGSEMPNDTKTVAAYAAGASLVAIATFYVFGPTFFIDGENSYNTSDGRKRAIIGLVNNANDCFINSVLQALAGLGDLRLYLIKELHRREIEGKDIYDIPPTVLNKGETAEKIVNLQRGPVTKALKDMLNALNERPIYKKTISARPIIEALEKAFRTRISRNQQDAQEFLQIVLERLSDEYHAAEKARKRAADAAIENEQLNGKGDIVPALDGHAKTVVSVATNEGFPSRARWSLKSNVNIAASRQNRQS